MDKDKVRIVIEMHGGIIQSVRTDSGHELDVVFTEAPKYVDGEERFPVAGGPLDGECVCCHHGSEKVPPADLDPVFKAAQERIERAADDFAKGTG